MLKKRLSIIFLSLLPLFSLHSEPEPYEVGTEGQNHYLGHHLEVFEDQNANLDLQDVLLRQTEFHPVLTDTPSFGFSSAAFWFRLRVKNQERQAIEWFLEFSYPLIDSIDLYAPSEKGEYKRISQGDQLPFHERAIAYRNFIFRLSEPASTERNYYFRIRTTSAVDVPVRGWTVTGLSRKINDEQTTLGGFIGIMAIMLAYNLILFFSIRDRSYIYYVMFVGAYTMFQLILNGLAFEYLWPNSVWWANNSLPLFISLSSLTAIQFGRSFMNVEKLAPSLNRILTGFMGGIGAFSALSLFIGYAVAIKIATILSLIAVILLIGTGTHFLRIKYRPAYYYMIAWTFFFFGVILFVLKTFGVLPDNFLTSWSVQIGSVLEVLLLSLGLGDRYNMMKKEREIAERELLEGKIQMFDSVSRFVPNQFINYLGKDNIMDVGFGDAIEKCMTVFFSDIRHFTYLSERMSVDENFRFLNSYFKRMGDPIHKNGGFIDKFIGDAIMALFPDSPDHAIKAAIEIRQALEDYNKLRKRQGFDPIETGIGINTGDLMLGTIGSSKRLNTTVIGDTVNLAARIESLTKTFKIPILISNFTYDALSDPTSYCIRRVDAVRVKGKSNSVTLYEVFDADPIEIREGKLKGMESYTTAISAYIQGDFQEAIEYFRRCEAISQEDTVVQMFLKRCNDLTLHPPGPNWKGISRVR